MGILLDIADSLHKEFHRSNTNTLDRERTLDLLELVTELAAEVEHLSLTLNKRSEGGTDAVEIP